MGGNVHEWLSGCEGTAYLIGPVRPHSSSALRYIDWLRLHANRSMAGDLRPVRVQVLKRGEKLCAVVVDASMGDNGQDWFSVVVNGQTRKLSMPGMKLRMCSGDGRCTCENEFQAAGEARACAGAAAAFSVPLGNTGTTVQGAA